LSLGLKGRPFKYGPSAIANAPLSLRAIKALLVRQMQFRDAIP
jgi:hypothetical protein